MARVCCVAGCETAASDDGRSYFPFPVAPSLLRSWRAALPPSSTVSADSLVCSLHFAAGDYDTVRGKVRLRSKVVPSRFGENLKPLPPKEIEKDVPESANDDKDITKSPKDDKETPESPKDDAHTKTLKKQNGKNKRGHKKRKAKRRRNSYSEDSASDKSWRSDLSEVEGDDNDNGAANEMMVTPDLGELMAMAQEVGDTIECVPELPPASPESGSEGAAATDDIEDIIANYHIKQDKELAERLKEAQMVERERLDKEKREREKLEREKREREKLEEEKREREKQEKREKDRLEIERKAKLKFQRKVKTVIKPPPPLSDDDDVVLVPNEETFVEIDVGGNESSRDCLMVMESLQVLLDPGQLLQTDLHSSSANDPVSLLTSSDDDDVILQEPHIDTVEVSDETDEDDVPLVKIAKRPLDKDSSIEKLALEKDRPLDLFGHTKEYFCYQCHWVTGSRCDIVVEELIRMWPRLLVFALALGSALGQAAPGTPAYYQLQEFKNNANGSAILTTRWGAPLSKAQAYGTLNSDLVFSARFLEEVSAFSRERIPPRVVNAKGAGAFGEFVVTHDVTDITNVALFSEIGKVTPLVARFSSVLSERGSPDTIRTPYGLAIKFYTEEGNWDFTGFSADTFAIKDPLFFPSACHAAFRNVRTNIPDPSAFYDFLFSFPTSVSVLSQFLGDMGVPASYRHVPGYNIHTFQVENDKQEISFVRFAAIPKQGLKYLNDTVAKELSASRPDYYTEDLYNAIESGDHPKWIFGMQVIRECDIPSDFDIFDVTLRWDYARFPIRPIGVVTLNRNPRNYFADIEQAAFSPGHLVPGMQGIDTLWQGRTMQYHDAAIARLGVNYLKIPVNRPRYSATYLRDGAAPVGDNGGDGPNYFPNVYRGPQPTDTRTRTKRVKVYTDPAPTNLAQTTAYYLSLSEGAKRRLAQNIANTLIYAYPAVQKRAEFERHRREHERTRKHGGGAPREKPHKVIRVCDTCHFSTASEVQFNRHRKKHKEEKKFKCSLCEYRAKHRVSLSYHMRAHRVTVTVTAPGVTVTAPTVTVTAPQVTVTESSERKRKKKKKKYRCQICKLATSNETEMLRHSRICRKRRLAAAPGTSSRLVQCPDCPYGTRRPSDLKRHRLRKHAEDEDDDYVPR